MKRVLAAAAIGLTLAGRGHAQVEPTPDYTVDAAQGPLTGSTRVIGLGGAFVAVAEGMDGVASNPAAVAVRQAYSWNRWDYGFGIDFAIGAWLPETDFLNQGDADQEGEVEQRSLLFGSVGATLQYEQAGIGISAEGQRQGLSRSDATAGLAPTNLSGNFGIVHGSVAYGFGGGQLVVGAGPRVTGVSLSGSSSSSGLLSVAGIGYQVGAVFKPSYYPFRIGVAYKSRVSPSLGSDGERPADGVYDVTAVTLPWQASAGVAVQIGPRRLNLPLATAEERTDALREELDRREEQRELALERAEREHELRQSADSIRALARAKAENRRKERADERLLSERERQANTALRNEYLARPRRYVLITSEVMLLGATTDSVAFGSVYQGRSSVQFSGQSFTVSPRLGLESEVGRNWLTLRVGSYLEPARIEGATDRLHGTFGFDLKLFSWDVFGLIGDFDSWRVSAAADGARSYLSTSFSIGFWH